MREATPPPRSPPPSSSPPWSLWWQRCGRRLGGPAPAGLGGRGGPRRACRTGVSSTAATRKVSVAWQRPAALGACRVACLAYTTNLVPRPRGLPKLATPHAGSTGCAPCRCARTLPATSCAAPAPPPAARQCWFPLQGGQQAGAILVILGDGRRHVSASPMGSKARAQVTPKPTASSAGLVGTVS